MEQVIQQITKQYNDFLLKYYLVFGKEKTRELINKGPSYSMERENTEDGVKFKIVCKFIDEDVLYGTE